MMLRDIRAVVRAGGSLTAAEGAELLRALDEARSVADRLKSERDALDKAIASTAKAVYDACEASISNVDSYFNYMDTVDLDSIIASNRRVGS